MTIESISDLQLLSTNKELWDKSRHVVVHVLLILVFGAQRHVKMEGKGK